MRKYTFIALMMAFLPLLSMGQSSLTLSITGYAANCNGSINGSAKVIPSGGVAPYSYTWSPAVSTLDSASGLAAGIYSVTVTDSVGTTVSSSVTITQPSPLIVYIDSIIVPSCYRTTSGIVCGCSNTLWAVVSGGTAPYSYLWNPGSEAGDTLVNACYTEFTVNVTDNNNCVTTDSINVVVPNTHLSFDPTEVTQVSNTAAGIITYPNPANNQLNISIAQSVTGVQSIAVYDMMGRKVFCQGLDGNVHTTTIDVSGFAEGNYLVKVITGASQEITRFSITR